MGARRSPLIRTRNDLLELIAHALRPQLSHLSKDEALVVADTILRTLKAAIIHPAAHIMPVPAEAALWKRRAWGARRHACTGSPRAALALVAKAISKYPPAAGALVNTTNAGARARARSERRRVAGM